MQTLRSKSVVISLLVLALACLGLLYYFFFAQQNTEPEIIVFNSYVCDDESFYFVLMQDEAIGVAGKMYDLVSSEDGMRYESSWPLAFTIRGEELQVSFKESGEEIARCTEGELETPPAVGI